MKRGASGINALIAVDKPLGLTSHDVVSRVRRAFGEKRVGHAGTLDPNASGVLVVGIGLATKLLGLLTLDRKGYVADISFGARTSRACSRCMRKVGGHHRSAATSGIRNLC